MSPAVIVIVGAMVAVMLLPAVRYLRLALFGFCLSAGVLLLIHAQTAPLEAGAGLAGLGVAYGARRFLRVLPG